MRFSISFIWIIMQSWICSYIQKAQSVQSIPDLNNKTIKDAFHLLSGDGYFIHDEKCDVVLMVRTIQTVVSIMQWKSIVIIHDNTQAISNFIPDTEKQAKDFRFPTINMEKHSYINSVFYHVLDSLWKHDTYTCLLDIRYQKGTSIPKHCQKQESEINILTICADENLQSYKSIFSTFENKIKFVLIISLNTSSIHLRHRFKDSALDNVALLMPFKPNGSEEDVCLNSLDISTLMYTRDGYRSFERRMIVTTTNFSLTRNILYPNLNFGLNKKKLLISALKSEPFCILSNKSGSLQMRGLYGEILNQLVKDLNFTYEIVFPEDGEWGRINDNGSWTGLVRLLEDKKVDMVLAPLAVSTERNQVIDYGTVIYYDHSSFLMRANAGGIRWITVLKPFQIQTFAVLFAVFMGSTFCLLFVEKCSVLSHGKDKSIMPTFAECLWYFFGASFAQGGTYATRSHSGAVFISIFWIYSVVVLVFYSGSLMSQLTVMKEQNMLETAKDIARQSRYTYGTLGGSYYSMKLKNSSRPIYKALYNNIMEFYKTDPEVLSTDHDVHYRKVKTENYVLILDKVYMTLKAATDCDLHVSSASFDVVQEAPGFPKGSPIRDIISEQILNYHDNGLIDLWITRSMPLNECLDVEKVQAKTLLIDDFISAFVALVFGIFVASIIFSIEKFCKCCSKVEKLFN